MEPFRAKAFPIVRDLIVDRAALDRIMQAGGLRERADWFRAPDANALPVPKFNLPTFRDGCGGVHRLRGLRGGLPELRARCLFAERQDFASLSLLPQGQAERGQTGAERWCVQMDEQGFGNCSNVYNCSAVCPKEISASFIARMNRDYMLAAAQEGLSGNDVRSGE